MVTTGVSVNVKTKTTFKYDYLPGFILCLKNAWLKHQKRIKNG